MGPSSFLPESGLLESSFSPPARVLPALDFFLRQPAAGRDGDLLFLAGAKVFRAHVQNAVRVDIEGDFNLGHPARRRRNVGQMKFTNSLVVARQRTLALEHVNLDTGLIVRGG